MNITNNIKETNMSKIVHEHYNSLKETCATCALFAPAHYMFHNICSACKKYKCSAIKRHNNVYLCNDCNNKERK